MVVVVVVVVIVVALGAVPVVVSVLIYHEHSKQRGQLLDLRLIKSEGSEEERPADDGWHDHPLCVEDVERIIEGDLEGGRKGGMRWDGVR